MQHLLARYLDGEISEAEAERLLRAAQQDPALEAELREYEAIQEAAESLPPLSAPEGFSRRVVAAVESARPEPAGVWRGWQLAAAALMVGLLAGGSLVRLAWPPAISPSLDPGAAVARGVPAITGAGISYLRAVRLIHAAGPDAHSVSVAGTFNDWDPSRTPMVRKDGLWTVLLIVPPGVHEYMFVEDGGRWVSDPHAPQSRPDGFGGMNGVLDVPL